MLILLLHLGVFSNTFLRNSLYCSSVRPLALTREIVIGPSDLHSSSYPSASSSVTSIGYIFSQLSNAYWHVAYVSCMFFWRWLSPDKSSTFLNLYQPAGPSLSSYSSSILHCSDFSPPSFFSAGPSTCYDCSATSTILCLLAVSILLCLFYY